MKTKQNKKQQQQQKSKQQPMLVMICIKEPLYSAGGNRN
jgi:hypothetical protein